MPMIEIDHKLWVNPKHVTRVEIRHTANTPHAVIWFSDGRKPYRTDDPSTMARIQEKLLPGSGKD